MEDAFGAGQIHGEMPVAEAKVRAAWLYYVEGLTQEQIAETLGLTPRGLARSPITGPAGNIEFLAWLQPGGPPIDAEAAIRGAVTG